MSRQGFAGGQSRQAESVTPSDVGLPPTVSVDLSDLVASLLEA